MELQLRCDLTYLQPSARSRHRRSVWRRPHRLAPVASSRKSRAASKIRLSAIPMRAKGYRLNAKTSEQRRANIRRWPHHPQQCTPEGPHPLAQASHRRGSAPGFLPGTEGVWVGIRRSREAVAARIRARACNPISIARGLPPCERCVSVDVRCKYCAALTHRRRKPGSKSAVADTSSADVMWT